MLRIVAAFAMIAGCYQPSFTNCAVRCEQSCPSGQTCGADGYCHAASDQTDCRNAPGTDAMSATDGAVNGTGVQGTPCDEAADCAPTFQCVGNQFSRSCHELCTDDSQCDGIGGLCNVTVGTSTQKLCTTNCNPVTTGAGGCATGWACHVAKNPNTMRDHTDCHTAGAGLQGASCAKLEDCAPGFACITLNPPRCLKYCVIGGPNVCPTATQCTPVGGGGYHIGATEYGICF